MKLSHSKLSCILSCPMTYYLIYKQGIFKKEEKAALAIGSAVHWGIEHNTEDLEDYFRQNGTFNQAQGFTREQLLSEAMVHGYLKHKDEIFADILKDDETGEQVELLEEIHEQYVTGKLKSYSHPEEPHEFVGIIDLLLKTNKGFILIDYKTSSFEPDWNDYTDQLYRYIFELRSNYPETPIYKIGIINIRKTGIKQKKDELEFAFLKRMQLEYDINDENYVNYHLYRPEEFDSRLLDAYIDNLSRMADTADMIDESGNFFINYGAAVGKYGKSDYYDMFYHNPNAYLQYTIADKVWNDDYEKFDERRDCRPIDMLVIDRKDVLNKFDKFKAILCGMYVMTEDIDKEKFFEHLKKNFLVDDDLLEKYWTTMIKEAEQVNEEVKKEEEKIVKLPYIIDIQL